MFVKNAESCYTRRRMDVIQRARLHIPSRLLVIAAFVGITTSWVASGHAQQVLPEWKPRAPQYVQCPAPGQPLVRIPELVAQDGRLQGTLLLSNASVRLFLGGRDASQCLPQDVRQFTGVNAALPGYAGSVPAGYPGYVPPPSYPGYAPVPPSEFADPMIGPTLRARIGDILELTFLNQIGTGAYWNSIDRGEKGQGCDESTAPYPGLDKFPDCFHGSSTGNIHFHGTHTNPGSTGDNVFIEVRPSLRDASGKPVVNEDSVKQSFHEFFSRCENELDRSVLSQWPMTWEDFPRSWVATQERLLKQYDNDPVILNRLWPVDEAQLRAGAWPQYYIGGTPYCFRLPAYVPPGPRQSARPAEHNAAAMSANAMDQMRALVMGQAPGTHWYHAHKHGSTTINVENGMVGTFIIEGGYDDALNAFYKEGWTGQEPWTRSQPVIVVNQLGVSTNLFGGGSQRGGPLPLSVNGRFQPVLTMQPGQVQLWRILDASSRGGVFLAGFAPASNPPPTQPSSPPIFAWKQTAQDGVQFRGVNYESSSNPALMLSPGNRVDLLVQAPTERGQYVLLASQVRSRCETLPVSEVPTIPVPQSGNNPPDPHICSPAPLTPLLTVNVTGTAASGNQALLIPRSQFDPTPPTVPPGLEFPPFLADVSDSEVKATKTVVFESSPTGPNGNPAVMHTMNGQQFDGDIGEVVLLNTAEEWKIVNKTVNGTISNGVVQRTDPPGVVDHPFHIHINPFQIVEFFDPNQVLPPVLLPNGSLLPARPKYIFAGTPQNGQCLLDINNPNTWKPCDNSPRSGLVWWDVFATPSARAVFLPLESQNPTNVVVVPGYFKMRSRFADYSGQYVMHCHILAHEDRGMMSVVEVVPFTTPYSHQ
jgi:FtsP/CotA-like multicopper oxidase with cupredoxin domain